MAVQKLTEQDVARLLADPSPETRAETAAKIAGQFDAAGLSPKERELAESIFRIMVKDAETRVREALSLSLKENPFVPHDVARALADDVDSVALPMLRFSDVLSVEDLIEIVGGQDAEKQKAIAARKSVDEAVSEALVEKGDEDVVVALVSNAGARISDGALEKVVEKFGDSARVQEPLVHRPALPVTVAERLVTRVSEHLKAHILTHHALPDGMADGIVAQSRERAVIDLSSASSEVDVDKLVRQMKKGGRLTPSILLRAACMGDMRFFESAMALMAGIPLVNARILIHDEGELGLKGLMEKARIPKTFFPAVRAAVEVFAETDFDGLDNDRERRSRKMIERILTQYGDLGVQFEGDDLEYLLAKMGALPPSILSA